jgi:hypothetical protein
MENNNRRQQKKQDKKQTKKCFSKCRKVPKGECTKNEQCIYVDGKRFQYCRLSHKYYLDEDCNAQLKTQTRKRRVPNKPHSSIIKSLPSPSKSLIEKENAGLKIKKFIMSKRKQAKEKLRLKAQLNISKALNKGHIQSKNLQTLCSDSSVCIAFGKQAKEISDFFNGYKKFDYVELPLRRIGAPSANGFIHEIKYSKLNYDAYAVLKSSADETTDNLYYEYRVGKFVNVANKILPSFLETYGLFQYKDDVTYDKFKTTKMIGTNLLTDAFTENPPTLKDACTHSKYMCILIQHIKNAETLSSYNTNITFIKQDLAYVLFQVYASLFVLSASFTHYDLHDDNVLLYQPVNGKYIMYHYHDKNGIIISFKCPYIAKIIDYGRCYYRLSHNENSRKLHEEICKLRECDPKCGEYVGFTALQDEVKPPAFNYVEATNLNESHDLRLLNIVKDEWRLDIKNPEIYSVLKKVVYGKGLKGRDKELGTREEKKSGLPKKINNVSDAYNALFKELKKPMNIGLNNTYYSDVYGYSKLGDLHIYMDGTQHPMRYEEA